MLVGQDIGLSEVIWISLFGMAVATIAIIILMIFVIIMSKIILLGKMAQKTVPVSKETTKMQPAISDPGSVTDDDIASITAALCMERRDQFRIVSITSR